MKYSWIGAIAVSAILSTSWLVGCGPRETPQSPLNPDAEMGSEQADADTSIADPPSPSPDPSPNPAPIEKPANGEAAISPPKAARLTAQQSEAQINLRSQPSTSSDSKGYGLVGDPVKLLRATEGSDGVTWYYVKFDQSGAEGWIRGDFINTAGVTAASNNQGAQAQIDSFTTDELFAAGSGGCGMTLMPADSNQFIFFNGLAGEGMWMKLDGTLTQFRRTAASGPEFYGQSATQSFTSADGATAVEVTVNVGTEEGYESVNIEGGTLRLQQGGNVTEIPVKGDAGC